MTNKPYYIPPFTNPEVERICDEMWVIGCSRVGNILNYEEANYLKNIFGIIMSDYRPWSDRFTKFAETQYFLPAFGDQDQAFLSNIAGIDSRADILLEKVLNHNILKDSLTLILGRDYKVWELSARRSNAFDRGLRLHQDAIGEFGVSVLLNDHFDAEGTTSFVAGSHKAKVSARESGAQDYLRPSIMRGFTGSVVGSAGDAFLFFKKTWHGRIKSRKKVPSDSLIFGLFPSGYRFKPFNIPDSTMQTLPSELKKLLRTDEGLTEDLDGLFKVLGETRSDRIIDLIYQKEHAVSSIWDYGPCIKPSLDLARRTYVNLRDSLRN